MQLSRSQFQGHPRIRVVSLSLLAGLVLGTHGQPVLNWVTFIKFNPQLLADLVHTQYSGRAVKTLMRILNSLPEVSLVLE